MDGFQKWVNGKLVDERYREWASPQPPILRNDLNDFDFDEQDPWKPVLLAAFKGGRGNLLKFSTGSIGGANSIRKLMQDWKQERGNRPTQVPVVELGSTNYQHKVHFTVIHTPVFRIVDWCLWDGAMPTVQAAATVKMSPAEGASTGMNGAPKMALPDWTADGPEPTAGSRFSVELSDDIPFSPEWRG